MRDKLNYLKYLDVQIYSSNTYVNDAQAAKPSLLAVIAKKEYENKVLYNLLIKILDSIKLIRSDTASQYNYDILACESISEFDNYIDENFINSGRCINVINFTCLLEQKNLSSKVTLNMLNSFSLSELSVNHSLKKQLWSDLQKFIDTI